MAIHELLEANRLEPDSSIHATNLASAYSSLDKRDDALSFVFAGMGKAPDDPLLKYMLDDLSKPAAKATSKPTDRNAVVVLPFGSAGGAVQRVGLGMMIADMLITEISNSTSTPVVERSRLGDLLKEQDLQQTSRFDSDTAVKLGGLIGAEHILIGNISEFSGSFELTAQLIEVSSSRVLGAHTARVDSGDVDALINATNQIPSALEM